MPSSTETSLSQKTSPSLICGAHRPDLMREETLADLFRASARNDPSKTALVCGERALRYEELDLWSDALAASLAERGIGRGAKVGVWWPRGLELHVIILGIAKAGAAYVPIDAEVPAERTLSVLSEVNAAACFSPKPLAANCPLLEVLEKPAHDLKITPPKGPTPDDIAYVLYTSGSTGKPKGIPITHRQICHLARAEQSLFGICSDDKVYQGFSVSFDMWCEETWISYLVGATLWVADALTAKAIDELGQLLRQNNITVLHAVPSLLSVLDNDIPSLRIVNAGGESCTPSVLARWATSERRFFNTYGPTETTVSATAAELKSGDLITIGAPLPNYGLAVVDEQLKPVAKGESGELVITGIGVSSGYVNREDLTREKFILKPDTLRDLPGERIYRTGDLVLINPQGQIDFLGRIDDQIKLRGYRIELGEIEGQLSAIPEIKTACVTVKKESQGQDQLVAYYVLANPSTVLEESKIKSTLSKFLPVYMVPSFYVQLEQMPLLVSGKIDRKSLPEPKRVFAKATPPTEDLPIRPDAPFEERISAVLNKIFPEQFQDLSQDFFDDLGGHSLLAAAFVSKLREEANVPVASLKDVYLHRPLKALSQHWKIQHKTQASAQERHVLPVSRWKYAICWAAQTVSLIFIYGFFAAQIFLPYLAYYYALQETAIHSIAILSALLAFCLVPPFFTILSIATKWLVLGRTRPGNYPLWGMYYFRWWLTKSVQKLMFVDYLNGTPLYPIYLRLLGAKISLDAQIGSVSIGAEDLVTIGSDVSISSNVVLNNTVIEDGWLKISEITLKDHAYIGSSSILGGGCLVEDFGELKDLSVLRAGTVIRTDEVWGGSPAELKATRAKQDRVLPLPVSQKTRLKYSAVYLVLLLAFPFTVLLPLLPSIVALNSLDDAAPDYSFSYLIYSPFLALSYIFLFALETVVLSRLLQWGIKPGSYPIYSKFYLRKWFSDQLMSLSLFVLHPIYATVYVSTLFRALGAKIGKRTEISTASQVTHPLLEIGEEGFIADSVNLGESDVRGQQLHLSKTSVGNHSFVGNSGLIPQGYHLPSHMLVGVLSVPPTLEQLEESTAKSWFGSPAIPLPRRQESAVFPSHLTTHPKKRQRLARGFIELCRIILPSTAVMCFSVLFIAYAHDLIVDESIGRLFLDFPFYYLFFVGLPSFALTVILKWIFVGKYKACQTPMWTWKVWRYEAITTTYEGLSVPFLLEYLQGTPWLPLALRLLGVRVGKRVFLNTTDITEFDEVEIGDEAAFNFQSGPQTHLFEDRVMKIGPVYIGPQSTIGARSIVLYESHLGAKTKLEPLSLVMKGERLAEGLCWEGSPVRPATGGGLEK